MGRYYEGDIQGKFAFAIQSSAAADRFGVLGNRPEYLEYYFNESNIEDIKSELTKIENTFGDYKNAILSYYDLELDITIYDYLSKAGITIPEDNLVNYHDYILGRKILECVIERGECYFTAELN